MAVVSKSRKVSLKQFQIYAHCNFDVKGAPCTGRPVIENVNEITEIIKVDRHVSSRSITQELKIDHKTVLNHLPKVGFKKKLDRDQYHLRAIALDKGLPQHRATVEVIIDVVDRANNPPIWDQPVYGPIFIKENYMVGQVVASIKARSGIPDNPTVFYTLMKGSTEQTNKKDTFYLDQRNLNGDTWADIQVNYPLDYERIQQYNLTVRVEQSVKLKTVIMSNQQCLDDGMK
ncbi:neural-cadherin [Trichonephila clavipes]|nr:neural-cadherin [Trichonephila clavipes]